MKILVRLRTVLRLQDIRSIRQHVNMCPYRCALIDASAVVLHTLCNEFTYECSMLARLEYDQNEAYSKQVQTVCFIRQSM